MYDKKKNNLNRIIRFRMLTVTRTGDRNPRFARCKLRQENRNENLADSLQGSHTETDNQKAPIAMNDYRGFLVTRTGDRNPRFARGKLRQENRNESFACSLQGSHTETDNQKIPIVLNDYRDFLVSHCPNMSNTCDTGISLRENSRALRLASELADLRAAKPNPCVLRTPCRSDE